MCAHARLLEAVRELMQGRQRGRGGRMWRQERKGRPHQKRPSRVEHGVDCLHPLPHGHGLISIFTQVLALQYAWLRSTAVTSEAV